MNTLSRALFAVATLFAVTTPAFAGKVKVRNCLDERVFVCAYNGDDSAMLLPADKRGIGPGKRKSVECATKKCKVFMAVSRKKAKNFDKFAMVIGGTGLAAGAAAVPMGAVMSTTLAGGFATGGAGVAAAGIAVAVFKGVEIGDNAKLCKKMRKAAKKNGIKAKAKGSYSLRSTTVDGYEVFSLEPGKDSCK